MEEKEFNELVSKLETASSTKITEQVKESLKELDIEALKALTENSATKEDLNELLKGEEFTTIKTQMQEMIDSVKLLKDNANSNETKTVSVAEQIKENKEALKNISKGLTANEVVLKANTVRSSISPNDHATDLNTIGQLAHAKLTAYDVFPNIPVSETNNNGTIRYVDWDESTSVRAANVVAEGGLFPESTAKFVMKTLQLVKLGDTLPVSDEFFEDEAMAAAELNLFLDTNVKIKRNDQIINGTGAAGEMKGLVTSAPVYTPVASGITDASIYDLFIKTSENITKTGGSKYSPNIGLMNIVDINRMKLKKDANNNYVMPPFVSQDGNNVGGMIVLEENSIVANTMVIGDSRFARIYEKSGVVISRGLVNAQFAEDMETIKARTRLLFLLRDADKAGFNKIVDIDAALTLLSA